MYSSEKDEGISVFANCVCVSWVHGMWVVIRKGNNLLYDRMFTLFEKRRYQWALHGGRFSKQFKITWETNVQIQ